MNRFKKAVKELSKFRKKWDSNNYHHCIKHGMLLLRKTEAQLIDDDHYVSVDIASCEWAMGQSVLNRNSSTTMMQAVIEYVEKIEWELWEYHGWNN